MNAKFIERVKDHWITSTSYYSIKNYEKFKEYFFPDNIAVHFTDSAKSMETSNTVIYDITHPDNGNIDKDKLNILICVENCPCHWHYEHYNKYGNYGDEKIGIYFYNHIARCAFGEKYMAIPVIYCQIRYFNKFYKEIQPTSFTPFSQKKFCIFVTNSFYRGDEKNTIKKFLIESGLGQCDSLDIYKGELHDKSCYHSVELLNILQRYKFVFVCENSLTNGYITEKIFNSFFARCVPIYNGSKETSEFIDKDSFINANNIDELHLLKDELVSLASNEELFKKKIGANKINRGFNDEDYAVKLKAFIEDRLGLL
jgi:hypothetical protein